MRIIAGRFGGRRIAAPKGLRTRPTTDRVREALFSALQSRDAIRDASVLDAYAGTGALGLEALSRGARHVTFVEQDPTAFEHLRRNVAELGVEGQTTLLKGDVLRILRSGRLLPGHPFSLLFLDPPYRMVPDHPLELLEDVLAAEGRLEDGAVVVWEYSSKDDRSPAWPEMFAGEEPRRYGDTSVAFAVYRSEESR